MRQRFLNALASRVFGPRWKPYPSPFFTIDEAIG
jgi:hypothetical protein